MVDALKYNSKTISKKKHLLIFELMLLKHLHLTNYKNFEAKSFQFQKKVSCFIGANGIGKSNVLDAIYQLAFGKSFFNPNASQNIRFNNDFFAIEGRFEINNRIEKIICSLKKGEKKQLKRNDKRYDKLADHIGLIPTVMISPMDRDLIVEGSQIRRKFMDGIIGQTNTEFLIHLLDYQKVLAQRNALLKYFALNHTFDEKTLEVYNQQLTTLSQPLYEARNEFIKVFLPLFNARHKFISNELETVSLKYISDLHTQNSKELLEESLSHDRRLQFTSKGVHKDDLEFLIDERPIKKFGSQGQQKTFSISLKLAQFDYLKVKTGHSPFILFDDAFDKLDENRVSKIIELTNTVDFGQIFISDTHRDRTINALEKAQASFEIFSL